MFRSIDFAFFSLACECNGWCWSRYECRHLVEIDRFHFSSMCLSHLLNFLFDRGAGPVGLLCIMWAKYRGAKRIFSIDCIEERLIKAKSQGAETIDFSKVNVVETMQKLLPGQTSSLSIFDNLLLHS